MPITLDIQETQCAKHLSKLPQHIGSKLADTTNEYSGRIYIPFGSTYCCWYLMVCDWSVRKWICSGPTQRFLQRPFLETLYLTMRETHLRENKCRPVGHGLNMENMENMNSYHPHPTLTHTVLIFPLWFIFRLWPRDRQPKSISPISCDAIITFLSYQIDDRKQFVLKHVGFSAATSSARMHLGNN